MAFGDMGPSFLPTSHIASEIEQPTNAQSLMAPYMGDPRQMYQFLMDPQNQEHMAKFGVHFNPDTIRESPFFSQGFMQQHPQLGGRLSSALAGAAAVPEAPLVSGIGSGIQRALQGGMGGPEMIRQFQRQQLQGPMQQMGMQIPPMEFERKQALLGDWSKMMQSSEDTRAQMADLQKRVEDRKGAEDLQKQQLSQDKINATRPIMSPYGIDTYKEGQPAQPGIPSPDRPELRGQSATQGGWNFQPWSEVAPRPGGQGTAPYFPGKPPAGGAGKQDAAGKAYQKRLGDYEAWIGKVQGNLVPAMGQEGSQQSPPRYWKDLSQQEQQMFMQQQQQIKQQWDNEYHQQAGGQSYSYSQNQPMTAPLTAARQGPMSTGKPSAPQGNFNQPPSDLMNPGYQQQQAPNAPPPGINPEDWNSLQQFPDYRQ